MSRLVLMAGLAATALTASVAQAQPATPTAARPYLRAAASGDQFEIQSSQLALRVSRDREVRRMAQMLIADHRRLSAETMRAARRARVMPPPPVLLPHHAAALRDLRSARALNFNRAFHRAQLTAHQEALALHQTYARSGDVPSLRATAAAAVPVVERHLRHLDRHPH